MVYTLAIYSRDFFCVFLEAEIRPHSQWNLGNLFPHCEKKSQSSKKKTTFFLDDWDFYSVNTHTYAHTQATW